MLAKVIDTEGKDVVCALNASFVSILCKCWQVDCKARKRSIELKHHFGNPTRSLVSSIGKY